MPGGLNNDIDYLPSRTLPHLGAGAALIGIGAGSAIATSGSESGRGEISFLPRPSGGLHRGNSLAEPDSHPTADHGKEPLDSSRSNLRRA